MKARILILTAVGSLLLAVGPAYAGNGAAPPRQLQTVVLPDGGSTPAARRAPTAIKRVTKTPWDSPNRSQVARNSF
jgi:hypothetical protein